MQSGNVSYGELKLKLLHILLRVVQSGEYKHAVDAARPMDNTPKTNRGHCSKDEISMRNWIGWAYGLYHSEACRNINAAVYFDNTGLPHSSTKDFKKLTREAQHPTIWNNYLKSLLCSSNIQIYCSNMASIVLLYITVGKMHFSNT